MLSLEFHSPFIVTRRINHQALTLCAPTTFYHRFNHFSSLILAASVGNRLMNPLNGCFSFFLSSFLSRINKDDEIFVWRQHIFLCNFYDDKPIIYYSIDLIKTKKRKKKRGKHMKNWNMIMIVPNQQRHRIVFTCKVR